MKKGLLYICILIKEIFAMEKSLKILETIGLRKTDTRKGILNLFLESDAALSLPEIEGAIKNLDRITLYRTLKTFESKGIIHRAIDGTPNPKYALCQNECTEHQHLDYHAHFHCRDCGKTTCLENVGIPKISIPKGYKVEETAIVISGKCLACTLN